MAAKIFDVLFNGFVIILNVILYPINTAISSLLPDLSQFIGYLTTSINLFFGNGLAYFLQILPPYTRYMILIYLIILVNYYTISISLHAITWAINVIKKLPLA